MVVARLEQLASERRIDTVPIHITFGFQDDVNAGRERGDSLLAVPGVDGPRTFAQQCRHDMNPLAADLPRSRTIANGFDPSVKFHAKTLIYTIRVSLFREHPILQAFFPVMYT